MAISNYPSSPGPRYVRYTEAGDGTAMATTVTAQYPCQVLWVGLHLDEALGEEDDDTLAITYVSGEGDEYNVLIDSEELAKLSDLSWHPDKPLYLMPGDSLSLTFDNDAGGEWGVTVILALL